MELSATCHESKEKSGMEICMAMQKFLTVVTKNIHRKLITTKAYPILYVETHPMVLRKLAASFYGAPRTVFLHSIEVNGILKASLTFLRYLFHLNKKSFDFLKYFFSERNSMK